MLVTSEKKSLLPHFRRRRTSHLANRNFCEPSTGWEAGRRRDKNDANEAKMDRQGHGGRVSRAGRRLRSVGEWWREQRLIAPDHDDTERPTERPPSKNAGWVPAFQKTLIGSGPRPAGIRKHRNRNRLTRKLVPGTGFIRCAPENGNVSSKTLGQGADAPTPQDAMSPQLRTPSYYDADALASALRAQKMQDDTGPTPTRRILNIYSSPSSSSKSDSEMASMPLEKVAKPSSSGFPKLSKTGEDFHRKAMHLTDGV